MNIYPNALSRSISKHPIRFGCREVAILSPKAETPQALQEQAEWTDKFLHSGYNSLQRQSERGPLRKDLDSDLWEKAKSNGDYIDDLKLFRADGWGIFSSHHRSNLATFIKRNLPTWHSSGFPFKKVVKQVSEDPKVILAHARNMPKDSPASTNDDVHPYQIADWTMMRHGMASPAGRQTLNRLHQAKVSSVYDLNSGSDTALLARCFAANLAQETGSTVIKDVSTSKIMDVLKTTVQEIAEAENPLEPSSTYNIVLTDGKRVFATSYSSSVPKFNIPPRPMLQATHTRQTDGKKEILLALEKMQPDPALEQLIWQELPNNSIASFTFNQNDEVESHIETLLPPAKAVHRS